MVEKKSEEESIIMYICETEFLILKPQLYKFIVDENCKRCKEMRDVYTHENS